ncbi:MAG: hypothetical protein HIU83_04750 [Proteobacteria bacterium]|nr:hypothetical protein [Pseudomonadota bacterium]
MNRTRLVIIGGDTAGMSAASQAKRHCPELEIVVMENGSGDSSPLSCGLRQP